jgi:23S rRNA (uracil1939-C5)-methyltransferase
MNPIDRQRATDNEQRAAVPFCPHFGPCGGCQLQHLTYAAQLDLKASRLRALLEAANLTVPELQLHPSPPFGYRNRIRLTLGMVDGDLRAGYLTSSSPDNLQPATCNSQLAFLPIRECPIAAPILWRTAEAFLDLINESRAVWLSNSQCTPDQLELFTTADESRLQLTLFLRTAAKSLPPKLAAAFTALCEGLLARIPELTGAGIAILPALSNQRSRRAEQPRPGPTWGPPGLSYTVSSLQPTTNNQRLSTGNLQPATSYWVPRGAFFQINRFLLPELVTLVTANQTGHLAWDLYAGVGLFSRALARSFSTVTAVEIAEPAFTALAAGSAPAAGSKAGKLPNLRAVKATTLDFLRAAVVDRDRPDLIVLDPPRTGAGLEICSLLARIAAPTLIYVSCSPETLPADLATLTASGYRIASLHLLDLFPQTIHIETLAILTR